MVGEGSLASLLDWLDDENIEDEEGYNQSNQYN